MVELHCNYTVHGHGGPGPGDPWGGRPPVGKEGEHPRLRRPQPAPQRATVRCEPAADSL